MTNSSDNKATDRKLSNNYGIFKKLINIFKSREIVLLLIILIMTFVIANFNPNFLKLSNFRSLSRGFSLEGIVIIGMAILLISGVFDLSVGSTMSLSGVVCAYLMVNGQSVIIAIIGGILTGAIIGFLNGFIITRFNINPLIATFGMMSIVRGIALASTQGQPIFGFPSSFIGIGRKSIGGFPISLYLLIILVIVADLSMRKIRFFRQFYFIGGNEESAGLTGINTKKMKIIAYIITGVLAAISGILSNARLMSAIPTAFKGVELKLIAASVIGGCSLKGGEGSIIGAIMGLVFMFLINNIMTILGVSMYWEKFVLGLVLVVVVIMNVGARKQKGS